jgi:hypothetical protein
MGGQSLLILSGTMEKKISFHFKCYNITIPTINFFETFCTCSPSSLQQDLIIKCAKKFLKNHFDFLI